VPAKILVVRLSALGDIVLTTPVLKALKKEYPEAQIDFLVKQQFAEVIRHHKALSRVIEFPAKGDFKDLQKCRAEIVANAYDLILDLHANMRSRFITFANGTARVKRFKKNVVRRFVLVKSGIDLYRACSSVIQRYLDVAELLPGKQKIAPPEVFIPKSTDQKVASLLSKWYSGSKIVVLAPGAGFFTKRWPAASFRTCNQKLVNAGYYTCILGSKEEAELGDAIGGEIDNCLNLCGKLSILESAAVLRRACRAITNDSGLMHISEAVGTPVIALFGSTVKQLGFAPVLPQSRVIEVAGLKCRPCSHVGRSQCPQTHFKCMNGITPDNVLNSIFA